MYVEIERSKQFRRNISPVNNLEIMAYAFGFPPDVTNLIYSFRDKTNWNGDKYRRGSTRNAANWADDETNIEALSPLPLLVLKSSSNRMLFNKMTPTANWEVSAHSVMPWKDLEIEFDYPPNDYSGIWR
jgi:hypothetical protein